MHHRAKPYVRTAPGTALQLVLRHVWLAGLLIGGMLALSHAYADTGLCPNGSQCSAVARPATASEGQLLDFRAALQRSSSARRDELSSQEYFSFSGVGAIVCTVNGEQRMSTAFLVGAFDIAVTVAHTFEDDGVPMAASDCIYSTTDSLGQIRERIEISYIKSQWEAEAGAIGQAAKDFAVVRLKEPSKYAQRTMPLGKFSGGFASVLLIGLRDDLESDPLKSKSRGTVFERKNGGVSLAALEGFTHDIDARGIAAGAPVIDERTGVIIGIHTLRAFDDTASSRPVTRNTMITMNEWLENTLRLEMQASDEKGANSNL